MLAQTPKPRTIDLTQPLYDLNGKPAVPPYPVGPGVTLTLGDAVTSALERGDEYGSAASVRADALVQRLFECKSCVVSESDVSMILEHLKRNHGFSTHIYAQVKKVLDPVGYEQDLKQ